MYAQLGNTVFDGTKSFVTFESDEEAVLVEYALINRKPKLQGTGLGLRNLSISLFVNQEFCVVADEIDKLRASKDSFEILPLLWGTGKVEGSFVIATMNIKHTFQDAIGNLIAAEISLTLKESVSDNTAPAPAGFASGDKKPIVKSKKVNPLSCSKQVSNTLQAMRSNAATVDKACRSYTGSQAENLTIYTAAVKVMSNANDILTATRTTGSCMYGNNSVGDGARDVNSKGSAVAIDASNANINGAQADNTLLQTSVKKLATLLAATNKTAILNG